MSKAIWFLLYGLFLLWLARYLGGYGWSLSWVAFSFLAVAVAYLTQSPRMFGKQADGTIAWWAWVLFLPFLALVRLGYELGRRFIREPASTEVAPGLFVGRRPRARELPDRTALVVDLVAEIPAERAVREHPGYRSIPTLDSTAPTVEQLQDILAQVAKTEGKVLLHCALGHGRSASVAAAVLLETGVVTSLDEAVSEMRKTRPTVGLNTVQRMRLGRLRGG